MKIFLEMKDEIVDSIENIEKKQDKTNDILLKILDETEEENETGEENETDEEDKQEKSDLNDLNIQEVQDLRTHEILSYIDYNLNEQNEILNKINNAQYETSWIIVLALTISLAFNYFANQLSKW